MAVTLETELPQQQIAIISSDPHASSIDGRLTVHHSAPVPALHEDRLLIRTRAVALNPVDYKSSISPFAVSGCFSGTDVAGVLVAKGTNAWTAAPMRPGDRVFGVVHGMHKITPDAGAFAQYVGATSHICLKIPDHLSFEEAAVMGTGIGTVGLALFRSLKVPGYPGNPVEKKTNLLIYGGSSATGTMAIQIAKLCGLTVLTTCSPNNFELVKSFGADYVYDYRSESAVVEIRKQTGTSLKLVLDCISEGSTMEFCYACIGRTGGRYTRLEPYPDGLHTRANVVPDWVLAPMLAGKPIAWPAPFEREADPELKEWAKTWYQTAQELLDDKKLKPHPTSMQGEGFEKILDGLARLGKKQVSGEKLVVRIPQTAEC